MRPLAIRVAVTAVREVHDRLEIGGPGGPHCTCDGASGEHLRAAGMTGSELEARRMGRDTRASGAA